MYIILTSNLMSQAKITQTRIRKVRIALSLIRFTASLTYIVLTLYLNYGTVNDGSLSINWFFEWSSLVRTIYLITDMIVFSLFFKIFSWFIMTKIEISN